MPVYERSRGLRWAIWILWLQAAVAGVLVVLVLGIPTPSISAALLGAAGLAVLGVASGYAARRLSTAAPGAWYLAIGLAAFEIGSGIAQMLMPPRPGMWISAGLLAGVLLLFLLFSDGVRWSLLEDPDVGAMRIGLVGVLIAGGLILTLATPAAANGPAPSNDFSTRVWRYVPPPQDSPSPPPPAGYLAPGHPVARAFAVATWHAGLEGAVMFGGTAPPGVRVPHWESRQDGTWYRSDTVPPGGALGDTWLFDGHWHEVVTVHSPPPEAHPTLLPSTGGTLWIQTHTGETWLLEAGRTARGIEGDWIRHVVPPGQPGSVPPLPAGSQAVLGPLTSGNRSLAVLRTGDGTTTWGYTDSWTALPADTPAFGQGVTGADMGSLSDGSFGQVVAFGGLDVYGRPVDATWLWTGALWVLLPGSRRP